MIYLAILALLLLLSYHYDICGKKEYKAYWYVAVLFIFILLAGLRWRVGVDTMRYLYLFYHDYPSLSNFSFKEYGLGKDPLFVLLVALVKSIGGRFYLVQIIQATFVNTLILKYFKKHSNYIFTCCFFYFLLSYISLTMETMRASFSIVISLYALDYFIEKKWLKGYLLLIIASMFHAQTLLLFLMPAFLSLRLNRKGIIVLIGAYIVGVFVQELLADYIYLFDGNENIGNKISAYTDEDSKYGKNAFNINYWIINILPKLFYPLFALWYTNKNCDLTNKIHVRQLEPLIMLGLAFVLIQTHFIIAYRYVEFFLVPFAILYSETSVSMVLKRIRNKKRRDIAYLKTMALFFPVMIYLVFFVAYKEHRYIYTTVIDMKVVPQKENHFKDLSINDYYMPNYNEY